MQIAEKLFTTFLQRDSTTVVASYKKRQLDKNGIGVWHESDI